MIAFDEGDLDEGIPIPDEISARGFGRFILAFGVDGGDVPDFVLGTKPVYGTRHDLTHLHRKYAMTILIFGNRLLAVIFTSDWKVSLWMQPKFGSNHRFVTDLHGNKSKEYYRAEQFPLYNLVAEKLRECRNGLTESDDVVTAFWLLSFGRLDTYRDRKSAFFGDQASFERDMLMLKMDERFTEMYESLRL